MGTAWRHTESVTGTSYSPVKDGHLPHIYTLKNMTFLEISLPLESGSSDCGAVIGQECVRDRWLNIQKAAGQDLVCVPTM